MKYVRENIFAAGSYLLINFALTWPLVIEMNHKAWGRTWDMINNLWFFDQVRQMIEAGNWSLTTNSIFYPFGYDLHMDLVHFLLPLLSVPFQYFLTLPATYNVLLFLSMTFTGWAAYSLARRFTVQPIAAYIAGLLWMTNVIAVRELHQGSLEVVTASCLFVLTFHALLHLAENPTLGRTAALTVAWFLTGIANWVLAGVLGMIFLVSVPLLAWKKYSGCGKRFLILSAVAMAIVLVTTCITVGPLLLDRDFSIIESDDRLAPIMPDGEMRIRKPHAGDPLSELEVDSLNPFDFLRSTEASAAPSAPLFWWMVLVLALVGVVTTKRHLLWMALLAVAFLLLAFGPYLQYPAQGRLPAWPMYRYFPGMSLFYRPYRFGWATLLLLIGPTSVGIAWLLNRCTKTLTRVALGAALALTIILIGWSNFQSDEKTLASVEVPVEYESVIKPLKPRAMIELPFFPFPICRVNAEAMLAQTVHHTPILNFTSLRTQQWLDFAKYADENVLIGALFDLQLKRFGSISVRTQDARELHRQGFDLILAHTRFSEDDSLTDCYRRLPHEVFLLLDTLYGAPKQLTIGRLYDLSSTSAEEEVTLSENAVVRLHIDWAFCDPHRGLCPGQFQFLTVEIDGENRSPVLSVIAPSVADETDSFCCWMRPFWEKRGQPKLFLEMGYDDPNDRMVYRIPISPPIREKWNWTCFSLTKVQSERNEEPFIPSRIRWLRFANESSFKVWVDIDDLAFVQQDVEEF